MCDRRNGTGHSSQHPSVRTWHKETKEDQLEMQEETQEILDSRS